MTTYTKLNIEQVKMALTNQVKDTASAFCLLLTNKESLESSRFETLLKCSDYNLGIRGIWVRDDKQFNLTFEEIDSEASEFFYRDAIELSGTGENGYGPIVLEHLFITSTRINFITDTYDINHVDYQFKTKKFEEPFLSKMTLYAKDGAMKGRNDEPLDFFISSNKKRIDLLGSNYHALKITPAHIEALDNVEWGTEIKNSQINRVKDSFIYAMNRKNDWQMGSILRDLKLIFWK